METVRKEILLAVSLSVLILYEHEGHRKALGAGKVEGVREISSLVHILFKCIFPLHYHLCFHVITLGKQTIFGSKNVRKYCNGSGAGAGCCLPRALLPSQPPPCFPFRPHLLPAFPGRLLSPSFPCCKSRL